MSTGKPPARKAITAHPTPPESQPLPGWPNALVEWRWVEPEGYTGDSPGEPRLVFRRIVIADPHDDETRAALRELRLRGLWHGPLLGDELPPPEGSTRRGIPPGATDPHLCGARTRGGGPCRSLALPNGRCKWHGGRSTGPRTPEGKRRSSANLILANAALARKRRGC